MRQRWIIDWYNVSNVIVYSVKCKTYDSFFCEKIYFFLILIGDYTANADCVSKNRRILNLNEH